MAPIYSLLWKSDTTRHFHRSVGGLNKTLFTDILTEPPWKEQERTGVMEEGVRLAGLAHLKP